MAGFLSVQARVKAREGVVTGISLSPRGVSQMTRAYIKSVCAQEQKVPMLLAEISVRLETRRLHCVLVSYRTF